MEDGAAAALTEARSSSDTSEMNEPGEKAVEEPVPSGGGKEVWRSGWEEALAMEGLRRLLGWDWGRASGGRFLGRDRLVSGGEPAGDAMIVRGGGGGEVEKVDVRWRFEAAGRWSEVAVPRRRFHTRMRRESYGHRVFGGNPRSPRLPSFPSLRSIVL